MRPPFAPAAEPLLPGSARAPRVARRAPASFGGGWVSWRTGHGNRYSACGARTRTRRGRRLPPARRGRYPEGAAPPPKRKTSQLVLKYAPLILLKNLQRPKNATFSGIKTPCPSRKNPVQGILESRFSELFSGILKTGGFSAESAIQACPLLCDIERRLRLKEAPVILNEVCEPATFIGACTRRRADAVEGPQISVWASCTCHSDMGFESAS